MLDVVRQCFGLSDQRIDRLRSIDSERRPSSSSIEKKCIFCKVTRENGFDIVESVSLRYEIHFPQRQGTAAEPLNAYS